MPPPPWRTPPGLLVRYPTTQGTCLAAAALLPPTIQPPSNLLSPRPQEIISGGSEERGDSTGWDSLPHASLFCLLASPELITPSADMTRSHAGGVCAAPDMSLCFKVHLSLWIDYLIDMFPHLYLWKLCSVLLPLSPC